jgi:hypothetical protein
MVLFYLLVLTFVVLVAIGGYDSTMRLIGYGDLTLRYQIIKLRMYFMGLEMKRQLDQDRKELLKYLEKTDEQ